MAVLAPPPPPSLLPSTRLQSAGDAALYSRDVDSAKGDEWIYDEVKDGHEEENQQGVQHLDDRGGGRWGGGKTAFLMTP